MENILTGITNIFAFSKKTLKSKRTLLFILTPVFFPAIIFIFSQLNFLNKDLKTASSVFSQEKKISKKPSIIHITTEFLEAKAGGLGAVVNEIVALQAEQGRDVTVILPLFQNDDATPAYDFLSISESVGSPKNITAFVGTSRIEALVYEYRIALPNKHTVRLKAIKPTGEFAYLTKIKDRTNPYILSNTATLTALDMWQQENVTIKHAHKKIKESYYNLLNIDTQIKEVSSAILNRLQDESFETTAPIERWYNGSLAYGEASYLDIKNNLIESSNLN